MGRPEVPEAEVFLSGETVEGKDCSVVDAASKLSFCANCVTLACVVFAVLRLALAAVVTAAGGCFVVPCVVCDAALGEEDVELLVMVSFVVLTAIVVGTDSANVVCEVVVFTGSSASGVAAEVAELTVVVSLTVVA